MNGMIIIDFTVQPTLLEADGRRVQPCPGVGFPGAPLFMNRSGVSLVANQKMMPPHGIVQVPSWKIELKLLAKEQEAVVYRF